MRNVAELDFRKVEITKAATSAKADLDRDCDACGAYLNFETLKTKCAECPIEKKRQRAAVRFTKLINAEVIAGCL